MDFVLVLLSPAFVAAAQVAEKFPQRSQTQTAHDGALVPAAFTASSDLIARAGSDWKKMIKQQLKKCVACGAAPARVGSSRGRYASPGRSSTGGTSPPTFMGAGTSRDRHASPDGPRHRPTGPAMSPGASTSRGRTSSPPCGTQQGSPTPSHSVTSAHASPSLQERVNRIAMHQPDVSLPHRLKFRMIEGGETIPMRLYINPPNPNP